MVFSKRNNLLVCTRIDDYIHLMKLKLTFMILVSFAFTQVTCAMSEADEIFLEAIEHSLIDTVGHDITAENHDEISEHQDELYGLSHCMHSHPPMTIMLTDTQIIFEPNEIEFGSSLIKLHTSIYHRPPVAPPIG